MSARVADGLRDLITRGTLGPGVHLGHAELAQQFSTSPVPIREALKLLASEELVQHHANRGFFVALLSFDDAIELYRFRHLLEHELLETVAWPTNRQLDALRARSLELDVLSAKDDRREWLVRHRDFRRAVFELSDQKIIIRELRRLWTRTDRYGSLLALQQSPKWNTSGAQVLVDALTKRDRNGLLRAFDMERLYVQEILVSALQPRER